MRNSLHARYMRVEYLQNHVDLSRYITFEV